jgi:hypothetical protein
VPDPTPQSHTPVKLHGEQIGEFTVLLSDAFKESELDMVVRTDLDAGLFTHFVAPGQAFITTCYQLIVAVERVGRTPELVRAIQKARPLVPKIQMFCTRYFTPAPVRPSDPATSSPASPPDELIVTLRELDSNLSGSSVRVSVLFMFIYPPLLFILFYPLLRTIGGEEGMKYGLSFGRSVFFLFVLLLLAGVVFLQARALRQYLDKARARTVDACIGKLVGSYPALVEAWGGAAKLRERRHVARVLADLDPRYND